jgi:hypothetical protein
MDQAGGVRGRDPAGRVDQHAQHLGPAARRWAPQPRSVCPATNSMAIHTTPAWVPTSCTATTFGWDSRASAWASRSRRSLPSSEPATRTAPAA